MKRGQKKLYVIRKYVMAKSCIDAIRQDKVSPVDDVWMDEAFKNNKLVDSIGFKN